MALTNYTEPVYYVKVIDLSGKSESLDLTSFVTRFKYGDFSKKADEVAISVMNHDLRFFDEPLLKKGNVLEVSWGYPQELAPPRQCIIDSVLGFEELEVLGHGKIMDLNRVKKQRTFQNMKRSDVVKVVLKDYGYNDYKFIQDTQEVIPRIAQANLTDYQFLKHLASYEYYDIFFDFDGPHFHETQTDQDPIKSFIWYGGTGALKSVRIKNDVMGQVGMVVVQGIDPNTKKTITQVGSITDTKRKALAPNTEGTIVSADEVGPLKKFVTTDPATPGTTSISAETGAEFRNPSLAEATQLTIATAQTSDALAKREADAKFRRSIESTVELEITAIGDPNFLAKSIVYVGNISKRLSGNYYVEAVVHDLGSGGYDCSANIIRDGHSETGSPTNPQQTNRGGGGDGSSGGAGVKTGDPNATQALPTDVDPETGQESINFYGTRARMIDLKQ